MKYKKDRLSYIFLTPFLHSFLSEGVSANLDKLENKSRRAGAAMDSSCGGKILRWKPLVGKSQQQQPQQPQQPLQQQLQQSRKQQQQVKRKPANQDDRNSVILDPDLL